MYSDTLHSWLHHHLSADLGMPVFIVLISVGASRYRHYVSDKRLA